MGDQIKLTLKQEKFCREYLVDFNGTQAAIRAGYSKRSAYNSASLNMRNDEIRKKINELLSHDYKIIGLNRDRILKEIISIAFNTEEKSQVRVRALESLLANMGQDTSMDQHRREVAEKLLKNIVKFKNK